MPLTPNPILVDAGLDLSNTLVIRHAYVEQHEDTGIELMLDVSEVAVIINRRK